MLKIVILFHFFSFLKVLGPLIALFQAQCFNSSYKNLINISFVNELGAQREFLLKR